MQIPPLPPSILTERLVARRWSPDDAPALRAALDASASHLRPWIPFMRDEPRSLEATRAWVEGFAADRRATRFALWSRSTKARADVLGEVMLLAHSAEHTLEVGYWLHVAHTGRGLAREAVTALVDVAFAQRGVRALCFRCDVRNHASSAIPRDLGAHQTGIETLAEHGQRVQLGVWTLAPTISATKHARPDPFPV